MFAETIDFIIFFFFADESSLFWEKGTKNYAADLSLYLIGSFSKLKIMLLTLSRSSSPYPVSLYLFKGFLSTSVMLFILKHGFWGDLTFSFHLTNN